MKIVQTYENFSVGDHIVCVNNEGYEELKEKTTYNVFDIDETNVVIDINGQLKTAWCGRFILESEYEKEMHDFLREERKKKLEKLEHNTEK